MTDEVQARRQRRKHSAEFKEQVVQSCRQAGVSVRSVAQLHGVDPSLVRHWLGEYKRRVGAGAIAAKSAPIVQRQLTQDAGAFLAVELEGRLAAGVAIHLELRRGPSAAVVDWPAQEAAACGAWLRDWLR